MLSTHFDDDDDDDFVCMHLPNLSLSKTRCYKKSIFKRVGKKYYISEEEHKTSIFNFKNSYTVE